MTISQDEMEQALELFREHWGHKQFRKAQAKVIEFALNHDDILAVLPTSYGKSACFQVPSLCREGTAIVISPLISLMKDQVDDALKRGIPASYVNSHIDREEATERFDDLRAGAFKLFYVAPERIRDQQFIHAIQNTDINYVVVDEAHCASRWGHDFRPSYMRIHEIVDAVSDLDGRPPIIAVTATATAGIEDDIAEALGMEEGYKRIIADPVRPNLSYNVASGNPWNNLRKLASRMDVRNGRYVIYCGTRKGCEQIASIISEQLGGNYTGHYHGGMNRADRNRVQDDFKSGKTPVVTATNAFGMGIDVPNIRGVYHFGIPGTLEDYMQEVGRAGRDGLASENWLLVQSNIHDDYSVGMRQMFLNAQNPPYQLYDCLWKWLHVELAEGEALKMSAKKVANILVEEADYRGQCDDKMVNTVLNVFERHKLVRRGEMPGGTAIVLTPKRFLAGRDACNKEREVKLWETIKRSQVDPEVEVNEHPPEAELTIGVQMRTLAGMAGVSEYAARMALKALENAGLLSKERTFAGKTTQIIQRNVDLRDVLPIEDIEAKRRRAQRRLNLMIEYTQLKDHERVPFIRSYFLDGMLEEDE